MKYIIFTAEAEQRRDFVTETCDTVTYSLVPWLVRDFEASAFLGSQTLPDLQSDGASHGRRHSVANLVQGDKDHINKIIWHY